MNMTRSTDYPLPVPADRIIDLSLAEALASADRVDAGTPYQR